MRNVHPTKPTSLFFVFCFLFFVALTSCSIEKKIARSAKTDVLNAKALQTAHIGLSIFDPSTNKYLYNYQGDKYFVPASNTKIPTCYAAMKYLGDSLVGLRYNFSKDTRTKEIFLSIQPTGDPTLLHSGFLTHPVWEFLQKNSKDFGFTTAIMDTVWQAEHWGNGWSWNDYDASYMAERSAFPIYGNLIEFEISPLQKRELLEEPYLDGGLSRNFFTTQNHFFDSIVNTNFNFISKRNFYLDSPRVGINRKFVENRFELTETNFRFRRISIPFITNGIQTAREFIRDSLKINLGFLRAHNRPGEKNHFRTLGPSEHGALLEINDWKRINSQPTDSLLKPMMHRSDNFFAEQSLLMVSNEKLGVMNDAKIIDTILKTDFKDLPQMPRWADGSGLSRYNLFTPQSLIAILNKMKNEFGMDRIKVIFPTGGEGTISNYYKSDSGYIYGKTGTLSGVVAFSGFMYTKKGKLLIFSTLVNNHRAEATDVRKAMEKFLQGIRSKY